MTNEDEHEYVMLTFEVSIRGVEILREALHFVLAEYNDGEGGFEEQEEEAQEHIQTLQTMLDLTERRLEELKAGQQPQGVH